MAHRRRGNDEAGAGCAGAIFLLAWGLISLFNRNPFWFSFVFGLIVVLILAGILYLSQRRKRRQANLIARDFYDETDPYEFEHAVAELFRQRGFETTVTQKSGDRGIDVLLKKDGQRMAVQCKRYRDRIGPGVVREFVGAMEGIGCKRGYIVTTSDFSREAKRTAKRSRYEVFLVDGELLGEWKNMVQKTMNTDLIRAKWWRTMTKAERGIVVSLFLLVVATASTGTMYIIVTWHR